MITKPALEGFRDLAARFAADRHSRQRRKNSCDRLRATRGCRLPADRHIDQVRRHLRERAAVNTCSGRDRARACPGRLVRRTGGVDAPGGAVTMGWLPMRSLIHIRRIGTHSGSCWAIWPSLTGSARSRVNRAAAATCRNRGPSRDRAQMVDGCCPARNTSAVAGGPFGGRGGTTMMTTETIAPKIAPKEETFESTRGLRIFYRSWRPAGTPRAVVAICHGFNAHSGQYLWAAEQLADRGLAVNALDLRGRGKPTASAISSSGSRTGPTTSAGSSASPSSASPTCRSSCSATAPAA